MWKCVFILIEKKKSLEQLWGYQKENNYDAIFLQETNYTAGKPLAYFKYWKTKMFTNSQNKAMLWCGNSNFNCSKNVFREDLSHKDLEIIWNEMQIQGEKNTCSKYQHSTWK